MLKKQKTLYLGLAREYSGGGGGGGGTEQVALLSITTAPSGSFAVGSKYYNSSTKKILTAVTADTWTGATSADPVFNTIYTFDSGYYIWDGNSLESTDLNIYEKTENKTDSYTETSSTKYPSSKALSDALGSLNCAGQIIKPLAQIDSVFSAAAKLSVKTSKFIIYDNGDVSVDGKTILKSNAIDGSVLDMIATETLLVCAYAQYIKVYSIVSDGTLTLVRTFNDAFFAGNNGIRFTTDNKLSYENGLWFIPCSRAVGAAGYLFTANITTDSEEDFTFANTGYVLCKIIYKFSQYIAFANVDGYTVFKYNSAPATIWSGTQNLITTGIYYTNIYSFGEEIQAFGRNSGATVFYQLNINSNLDASYEFTQIPSRVEKVKLIGTNYYLMDTINGEYSLTAGLNVTPVKSDTSGYDAETIGTNEVITLNSTNIMWKGYENVLASDFQKLGYSQLKDKPITNTETETSIFNKSPNEFEGSAIIPPNSLKRGDVIVICVAGVISTASAQSTNILKVKFGGVELVSNSKAVTGNLDNNLFKINCSIVVREIGAEGKMLLLGNTTVGTIAGVFRELIGTEVTVDTTNFNLLDLTYKWGTATAENTITAMQSTVEIKRQW